MSVNNSTENNIGITVKSYIAVAYGGTARGAGVSLFNALLFILKPAYNIVVNTGSFIRTNGRKQALADVALNFDGSRGDVDGFADIGSGRSSIGRF